MEIKNLKPSNHLRKRFLNSEFKEMIQRGFQMRTDYNEIIPVGVLFNLKEVEEMRIIKVDMAKKLIANRELEAVKIGNKLHLSRTELIHYLQRNTLSVNML